MSTAASPSSSKRAKAKRVTLRPMYDADQLCATIKDDIKRKKLGDLGPAHRADFDRHLALVGRPSHVTVVPGTTGQLVSAPPLAGQLRLEM